MTKWTRIYPSLLVILLGYLTADLIILNNRDRMIPNQAPPQNQMMTPPLPFESRSSYTPIVTRNMFSLDGTMPDALVAKDLKKKESEEAPVLSNLPINLVGTIVMSNPKKSIANIEIKSKNQVISVTPNHDIEKLATLLKVDRYKAFIRNLNNSMLEYLEMKTGGTKLSIGKAHGSASSKNLIGGSDDVKLVGNNKFEIKRSDLIKYLSDLPGILQQAAMQPKRNANGEIEGFKFLSIQPGTIYTQLGFQVGDTIKSVNGEPVDSPTKAMELFNTLKGADGVKISVERDGKTQENEYSIK